MHDAPRPKLPVPAKWQAPVLSAVEDLCSRLGIPRDAVAVTRVGDSSDTAPATGGSAARPPLDVWLIAGGRTYRYAVTSEGAAPRRNPR